jgi:SAM-dependent methyltransferase
MIGSELAPYPEYLLSRASQELGIRPKLSLLAQRLAPRYIALFGVPEIGVQLRIGRVLKSLPVGAGSFVDVGSGAGMLLGAIHRRLPNARLVGIEIERGSVEIARKSHPYATIELGGVVQVAKEYANQFDCAVCIDVLEHIDSSELAEFVEATVSLLKPHGRAIIHVPAVGQIRHFKAFEDWGHHDHAREGFSEVELRSLMNNAGLEVVEIEGTFGYGASLAWELNMLSGATVLQALTFPPLMLLASLAERLPQTRQNGWLVLAARRNREK